MELVSLTYGRMIYLETNWSREYLYNKVDNGEAAVLGNK